MTPKRALKFNSQGGAVPNDGSYVYVHRHHEEKLFNYLLNNESVILYGPRQIGKTTIAISAANRLKKKGHRVAWLNLQTHISQFEDIYHWSYNILNRLCRDFNISEEFLRKWLKEKGELAFPVLFKDFFLEVISKKQDLKSQPISVFIDEIDYTLKLSEFSDNLFKGIRAIHNEWHQMEKNPLIAFTLIGVTQPYELFKEKGMPFGIGHQVELPDFENDESVVNTLTEGLESPVIQEKKQVVREILNWTGGQPYLTILLCNEFKLNSRKSSREVVPLIESFIKKQKKFPSEHFKTPGDLILRFKERAYRSLMIYKDILKGSGEPNLDWEQYYNVLRMAGLIVLRGDRWKVKCPIYERYFDEIWCKAFGNQINVEIPQVGAYILPFSRTSDKFKLFILNTGGTIGMEVQSNGIVGPYKNPQRDFIKNFSLIWKVLEEQCDIIFEQIACKDGANIFPQDWSDIARRVWELRNEGDKRGVVITHGTDTMAYTASAVAFALGAGLNYPVVFTGSQTTYAAPHGDSNSNLLRSCLVALEGSIKEVVICFGDTVFRGCRSQKKHDQRFEGFESPSFKPLAYITEKINVQHELLLKRDNLVPFELKNKFAEEVLLVVQYPSLNPNMLISAIEENELKGVIIQTLGVGNVPTLGKYSLLPFIERATQKGVPVLVTNQYPVNPEVRIQYTPASSAISAGAIPTGNMTSAAAMTKFQWVLAQIDNMIKKGDLRKEMKLKEVKRMMNINYIGEMDELIIRDE